MKVIDGRRHKGVPAPERFRSRIQRDELTECWEFHGFHDPAGYARFTPVGSKSMQAHRYSYELHRGPIPEGLHLDHLCMNPGCVNPDHLEPVTLTENTRRGRAVAEALSP